MRTKTATWFECRVKYVKVMDDGMQKTVTEQYVVDAMSFTEAESCIIEEMQQYVSGAFEVVDVKKAPYKEVFFADSVAPQWYRLKLDFITLDEKTGKEKSSRVTYLVEADSLIGALKMVDPAMSGSMADYRAASITDTKIMDVFEKEK